MKWIIGYDSSGRIVHSQTCNMDYDEFPKEVGVSYLLVEKETAPDRFYCKGGKIIEKIQPKYTFKIENGFLYIDGLEKESFIAIEDKEFVVEESGLFEIEFDEVGRYEIEVNNAVKYLDIKKEVIIE